nr:isoleucine--tRNA ligase [Clostridia bacterium]
GLVIEQNYDVTVALDVRLTNELIEEGFVREIISKVQTMRKESGFEITDRIILRYSGNEKIAEIIKKHAEQIADEVLAIRMEEGIGENAREWNLNGERCTLSVERVTAEFK